MSRLSRKTKRLMIRPLVLADYEMWSEAHSTMLAAKNKWDRQNKPIEDLTLAKFKTILFSQRRLRNDDKFYDCAVFDRKSQKLIGAVSVMDVLRGVGQSAYLGYVIFNRFWGVGYGKEAVAAMIDIGFQDIRIHRLEAGIEPTNRRSILLARSLGMRKEGLKKKAVFLKGSWVDLGTYAATCEDFGIRWTGEAKPRPK